MVDLAGNTQRCNCCPSKKGRRVSSTREETQASWVGAAFDVDFPRRLPIDLLEVCAAFVVGFALGLLLIPPKRETQ